MRPIKLRFAGLRSYRAETTIDFTDLDLFAVIGDTGAGKSTIIEALCLALYARKSWQGGAGLSDMISDGMNSMLIEFTFGANGDEWVVTRSRHRNSSAPVDKLESPTSGVRVDGAAAVTAKVSEVIGLDYAQFTRAVVLPQGRFDSLLRAGAIERNQILTSILDLGDISATRTQVEHLSSRWAEEVSRQRGRREQLPLDVDGAVRDAQVAATDARERRNALSAALATVDAAVTVTAPLEQPLERLRSALTGVSELDPATVVDLSERVESWEALVEERAGELAKVEALDAATATLTAEAATALAGFADRDALVAESSRLARVVEALPGALSAHTDAQETLTVLEANPVSAEESPVLRAAVLSAATAREQAETEHQAARTSFDAAAKLWDQHVAAVAAVGEADQAVAAAETAAREAQDAVTAAEELERETRDRLAAAKEAAQVAQVADAAATAAARCAPGDSCPICTRPLPTTFTPPTPAESTATTTAALKEAEAAERAATTTSNLAAAAHTTATSDLTRVRDQATAAHAALVVTREALEVAGVNPEAGSQDDALAPQRTLLEATSDRLRSTEEELRAAEVASAEAAVATRAAAEAHQSDLARAAAAVATTEAEIAGLIAVVDALPPGWAPTDCDPVSAASSALAALNDARDALVATEEALRTHAASRLAATESVGRLAARERDEARDPARAIVRLVVSHLDSVRAVISSAAEVAAIIDAPLTPEPLPHIPEVSSPHDLRIALSSISSAVDQGVRLVAAAHQVEQSAAAVLETAAERVTSALATVECADPGELRSEHGTAGERLRNAEQAVSAAESDQQAAKLIDEVLTVAGPFSANLKVLSAALKPQHFIDHLVALRERDLLAEASRRLKELTKGQFGFVADFGIVNIGSGEVRTPDTLSGGERFQAALALALALVEIASRGGGRLDAVFVDEGFGSLDSKALDDALETLGLVAGDGKMVALISHLRPVAEYVDTVLHVTKDETLGSRITLLDADARDAMLADDTRSGLTA